MMTVEEQLSPENWPPHCTRCGLALTKVVWLELSTLTGRYYVPGQIADSSSQGLFPFGTTCAGEEMKRPATVQVGPERRRANRRAHHADRRTGRLEDLIGRLSRAEGDLEAYIAGVLRDQGLDPEMDLDNPKG